MQFDYSVQWSLGKEGKDIDLVLFRYADESSSGYFCCCRGAVSTAFQKFRELLRLCEEKETSLFSEVSLGGYITAKYRDDKVFFCMEKEKDSAISVFSLRIPSPVCAPVLQKLCKELEKYI
nr:hypothetical protein [Marseillevirus cajuinensis]